MVREPGLKCCSNMTFRDSSATLNIRLAIWRGLAQGANVWRDITNPRTRAMRLITGIPKEFSAMAHGSVPADCPRPTAEEDKECNLEIEDK
jgi:hypothetical protein